MRSTSKELVRAARYRAKHREEINARKRAVRALRPKKPRQSMAERFWKKVKKTRGCWLWNGAITTGGYGCLGIGSRTDGTRASERAHRVAWMLTRGPIPAGIFVLHRCDNPRCVCPAHLFLGTHADNMQDMRAKGRSGHKGAHPGEKHHFARLNRQDVQKIRAQYAAGASSQDVLAMKFGITQGHCGRIIRGEAWAEKGLIDD